MQHPDEGTIHSWLDGALSAEEAARVESHVSDCASCAATVAEARGFIAASSRILTALDNVPRGVLPAVPAKKRDFRIAWRAAAAMLIVAGGSLVVMRDDAPDARIASDVIKTTAADQVTAATRSTDSAPATQDAKPLPSAGIATSGSAPAKPPVTSAERAESPRQSAVSTGSDLGRAKAPVAEIAAATGAAATAAAATAPSALQMQMRGASESDGAALRVVKVETTPTARRTTYQVAQSETVTLTEPERDSTSSPRIVLRGSSGAVTSGRAERRTTRSVSPLSAEAANAPPPPPPSPVMDSKAAAAFTTATNTITWVEARTGKTLTLSGNVSVERLQEIRKLVETQRAASEARNRLPATTPQNR